MLSSFTEILTNRFILRPLSVCDVSERYVTWLNDQVTSQYITAKLNLDELRQYVLKRNAQMDTLFLGIFEKETRLHIGNIKYEPVNSVLGYAIMGILIGEADYRGKGVATEVISASANWLCQFCNIKQIVLGLNRANIAAIRAYQKTGFVEELTTLIQTVSAENLTMVWHL
ncbi:GNAT family N-acetyltransferase [Leptospira noguchii]|uniref:Acetyltransferase (GNAT) domain protein n=1 Tax=Leptospira noguchii serovar Panama str. CZ214 TaxID=1001595 RepID=T0F9A0_9LEPT|nr:GNAT family N-acetyltransferase [Leptospira noguchii]EQA69763.1 acetyltransferase (GNAT) domain protein [Leptospira noguchii serovar Panama str. CZ214]MCH1913320.1 GNAT family N-acetyltransferase [Leptospira noguchii]MCH1915417.1 GNAT family N-acetyltransferase [Leptospira noguchii]UOG65266.1 GNAT family N-acetyltransferase [Leptospira noguchii]